MRAQVGMVDSPVSLVWWGEVDNTLSAPGASSVILPL